MIPDLFHNGKNLQWSRLCFFTMGKFAMVPALFHNEKVCNDPGSVSQWENLLHWFSFLSLCFVNSTFNLSEIWSTLFP